MMRFKRNKGKVAMVILVIIAIVGAIRIFYAACILENFIQAMVITMILLVIVIVVGKFPDDFDYIIRVEETYIVIEESKNCHTRLDKHFTIADKNWYTILLTDGLTRIPIGYNKKVLEFLDSVKES